MVDSQAGERNGWCPGALEAEGKQCQLPFPGGRSPCTSVAGVCLVVVVGVGCGEVPKALQLPSLCLRAKPSLRPCSP